MLKYQLCLAFQHLDEQTVPKKMKKFSSILLSLGQNIEIQIVVTWSDLSTYLIFVINKPPSNFSMQKAES